MKIYGCGGLGLNLASKFEALRSKESVNMDAIDISYIDTSMANVRHNKINPEHFYLITKGSDNDVKKGSGKFRPENYEPTKEQIKKILMKHPPEQFNCVIHSLSGGSGSVIGPILFKELRDQGKDAILLIVGNNDSTIEITNTISTLHTYVSISRARNESIVGIYSRCGGAISRAEADSRVISSISLISLFFNPTNQEMDMADISNFLNYNKVTKHEPAFVFASFFTDKVDVDEKLFPIAALTLGKIGEDSSTGTNVDYQAVGYVNEDSVGDVQKKFPIHLVSIDGQVANELSWYEQISKQIEAKRAAAIGNKIEVKKSLDDGMVF